MKYVSTRSQTVPLDFEQALFKGLAPDGGLYLPETIPFFDPSAIERLSSLSYAEFAVEILHPFLADAMDGEELLGIVKQSLSRFKSLPEFPHQPAPLRKLEDDLFLLELFHGPTLAFKDFALQFLAGLFDFFLKKNQKRLIILGATSGDTGSAAIEAFRHYPNIEIVILHPHQKVSPLQRKQMTTVDSLNLSNLAVEGNFDDCQKLVKQCFSDQSFLPSEYNLTAVNSINWARIMAQVVYYFSAFFSSGAHRDKHYYFTVPTGNFGNVFAGYLAMKMGLSIKKLIVASNANDILHRFFFENDYRITSLQETYSPSMDILVSSNLERLLYEIHHPYFPVEKLGESKKYGNIEAGKKVSNLMHQLQTDGKMKLSDEIWEKITRVFLSTTRNDQETIATIVDCYRRYGIVIDPHTAVGLGGMMDLKSQINDEKAIHIVLATAHPAKFLSTVDQARLQEPSINSSELSCLFHLEDRPEHFTVIPNQLSALKKIITDKISEKS